MLTRTPPISASIRSNIRPMPGLTHPLMSSGYGRTAMKSMSWSPSRRCRRLSLSGGGGKAVIGRA